MMLMRQGANRSATREPMRPQPDDSQRDAGIIVEKPGPQIGALQGKIAPPPFFTCRSFSRTFFFSTARMFAKLSLRDAAPIGFGRRMHDDDAPLRRSSTSQLSKPTV